MSKIGYEISKTQKWQRTWHVHQNYTIVSKPKIKIENNRKLVKKWKKKGKIKIKKKEKKIKKKKKKKERKKIKKMKKMKKKTKKGKKGKK